MYPAVASCLLLFAAQDSAAFVTRLGRDTLVVERFVRVSNRLQADVVMRVPATSRIRYVLDLSPSGELSRLETVVSSPARREVITRQGDSLRVEITDTGATRVRTVAAEGRVLPFLDMVHWPFELVLMRLKSSSSSQTAQPLLSGSDCSGIAANCSYGSPWRRAPSSAGRRPRQHAAPPVALERQEQSVHHVQ